MTPIISALTTMADQLETRASLHDPIDDAEMFDLAAEIRTLATTLDEPRPTGEVTPQGCKFWASRMAVWSGFMGKGSSPDPEDVRTAARMLFGAARALESATVRPVLRVVK